MKVFIPLLMLIVLAVTTVIILRMHKNEKNRSVRYLNRQYVLAVKRAKRYYRSNAPLYEYYMKEADRYDMLLKASAEELEEKEE